MTVVIKPVGFETRAGFGKYPSSEIMKKLVEFFPFHDNQGLRLEDSDFLYEIDEAALSTALKNIETQFPDARGDVSVDLFGEISPDAL